MTDTVPAVLVRNIKAEIKKEMYGLDEVIDLCLVALFTQGHVLLEGNPGLRKTALVKTMGEVLGLKFSRIQFTPDLMPSDITGTEIIAENRSTGQREFKFLEGPLFAVTVAHCKLIKPAELRAVDGVFRLH